MKINMSVTNEQEDGSETTYQVVADSRDIRKYEETFETSWLNSDVSMIQMTQLAWIASRRHDLFAGDYASFDKINIDTSSKRLETGEVDTGNPTSTAA